MIRHALVYRWRKLGGWVGGRGVWICGAGILNKKIPKQKANIPPPQIKKRMSCYCLCYKSAFFSILPASSIMINFIGIIFLILYGTAKSKLLYFEFRIGSLYPLKSVYVTDPSIWVILWFIKLLFQKRTIGFSVSGTNIPLFRNSENSVLWWVVGWVGTWVVILNPFDFRVC